MKVCKAASRSAYQCLNWRRRDDVAAIDLCPAAGDDCGGSWLGLI